MPRTVEYDFIADASPADLVAVYTDPAFLEAEARVLGALEARAEVVERTEGRARLRIHVRAANRDPRTRDKETRYTVDYDWDLASSSCRWRRTPDRDDKVDVSGTHRATPAGDGCRYLMTWDIDVRVRLMGSIIERTLVSGLLDAAEERSRFARQWLARA